MAQASPSNPPIKEQDPSSKLRIENTAPRESNPKTFLVIALNGVTVAEKAGYNFWKTLKPEGTVIFTQDCHFLEECLADGQAISKFRAIIIADNALCMNFEFIRETSPIIRAITQYMEEGGTVIMGVQFAHGISSNTTKFNHFFNQGLKLSWIYHAQAKYEGQYVELSARVNSETVKGIMEGRAGLQVKPTPRTLKVECTAAPFFLIKNVESGIIWKYVQKSAQTGNAKNEALSEFTSVLFSTYGKGRVGFAGIVSDEREHKGKFFPLYNAIMAMCGLGGTVCKVCGEAIKKLKPDARTLCCMVCRSTFCSDTCQLVGAIDKKG